MAYLILVRHGKSKWNALGKWQGWRDIELAPEGVLEARRAAKALRGIVINAAYCSRLKRAKQTWRVMQSVLKLNHIHTTFTEALNERHYGIYAGKNKWQIRNQVGEKEFKKIRRGWSHPIPGGESLKQVHARVVPFYRSNILEDLRQGKNVVVVAHGNSLRALVKHLEGLSAKEVGDVEVGIGEAHVYKVDKHGKAHKKEIRAANAKRGKI